MKTSTACGLSLVLLAFCGLAAAEEPPYRSAAVGWEFAPFYGFRFGGDFDSADEADSVDFDLDNSPAWGALLEFPSGHHTQWQVFYTRQDTELDTSASLLAPGKLDLTIEYLHLGGIYVMEGERDRPYVGVSFGGTRFSPEGDYDDEIEFSVALLAGIKFRMSEHVGVRLDARALGNLTQGESEFFCDGGCVARFTGGGFWQAEVTVGLNFYL
jgi:hypothetical protein